MVDFHGISLNFKVISKNMVSHVTVSWQQTKGCSELRNYPVCNSRTRCLSSFILLRRKLRQMARRYFKRNNFADNSEKQILFPARLFMERFYPIFGAIIIHKNANKKHFLRSFHVFTPRTDSKLRLQGLNVSRFSQKPNVKGVQNPTRGTLAPGLDATFKRMSPYPAPQRSVIGGLL